MSLYDPDVHTTVLTHKEDGASRVLTDATDREKIRNQFVTCVYPLYPTSHSTENNMNMVTVSISPATVNVDGFVQLEEQLMRNICLRLRNEQIA